MMKSPKSQRGSSIRSIQTDIYIKTLTLRNLTEHIKVIPDKITNLFKD